MNAKARWAEMARRAVRSFGDDRLCWYSAEDDIDPQGVHTAAADMITALLHMADERGLVAASVLHRALQNYVVDLMDDQVEDNESEAVAAAVGILAEAIPLTEPFPPDLWSEEGEAE